MPSSSPASKTDDDPGVVEAGDGVGLAAGAVVGAAVGGDRLDRDIAPQALVARLVDRAEPARADARTQPVAPQGERRVGLSDELFGGLHGERSFAAARAPTFTPQRACGPLRRRDGHTSRLVLLRRGRRAPRAVRARAEARRWVTPSADQQTLLVRRVVAIGGLLLLLILLFFVVRSCCELAQGERAEGLQPRGRLDRPRVRHAGRRAFFELLGRPATSRPRTSRRNISGYRVQAESQLKQAAGARRPGRDEGAPSSRC